MGKTRGRPKTKPEADRHSDVAILMRVDPALKEALQGVADEERRSLSQMCVILLEEVMKNKGKWTPTAKK